MVTDSAEWVAEAEKRGLPNLKNTPEALKPLLDADNQRLVEKYGVFSKVEMSSRYEVFLYDYNRRLRIEGEIALEMATSMVRPVAQKDFARLSDALAKANSTGIKEGLSGLRVATKAAGQRLDRLTEACDNLKKSISVEKHEDIIKDMKALRAVVDELEHEVDDHEWPLPKYREMLFIY